MNQPLYVDEDVSRKVWIVCPECDRQVKTQSNATNTVWILTHEWSSGNCPASGKEVRSRPRT